MPPVDELRSIGAAAGLDRHRRRPAEPFLSARADLHERRAAGLDGGMQFTYRRPERSTDPASALPGAHLARRGSSAIPGQVLREPAGSLPGGWPPTPDPTTTRTPGRPRAVASRLEADGWRTRWWPTTTRWSTARRPYRAGLGWYGKNSNLLLPGAGSWFVLGSVITDAPLPTSARLSDGCGPCRRCLDGCPTGAIVAPGSSTPAGAWPGSSRLRGRSPRSFRPALGDRIYGCDDCQEVCPPNRAQIQSDASADEAAPSRVPVLDLLDAPTTSCSTSHGRWYIPERDPRYLRRNALVVLGNVGSADDERVVRAIRRCRLLHRGSAAPGSTLGGPPAASAWRRGAGRADLKHLLVTNDFPPKVGGIQSYLWELWRRLPPDDVTVLTTPWPDAAAWDAEQAFRVVRVPERVLLPTR